ncbi:MAG TPA: D-Ala-D-Ala carboxypeptidase family metallohydrolase [Thermoanaerobaculia bacterium]|nr:D-Ala-D-Ala carboxypeptidase family metallohydrolase [Thermoanaerobaculia bacterium]
MKTTRAVARLLSFALLATTVSLHAEDHGTDALRTAPPSGTRIELQSVPQFVQRLFVPTMPEATNTFTVAAQTVDEVLEAPAGFNLDLHNGGLSIEAPAGEASGYARVRFGGREVTLTLVNLIPSDRVQNGVLEGYRVGAYREPLNGLESYSKPLGFMRLTDENGELWVSDHYRMRDFQCKLDGDSKFLILRTEALLKLELLQHELAARGVDFDRFTIMSGYRTPYYNSRIGNETSYSRHLYGDAMDVYIDRNGDGKMDDINKDGRIDSNDAKFLQSIAAGLDESRDWGWLKGGAGVYHANAAHGPYLHVDARGYVARWGV